jgi:hypothetical protein
MAKVAQGPGDTEPAATPRRAEDSPALRTHTSESMTRQRRTDLDKGAYELRSPCGPFMHQ